LGLASIAAVLEQKGHTVEIIDANALQLSEREIVKKVKGADVIGITAMTPAVNSAIKIAKEVNFEALENNEDFQNINKDFIS